MPFCKAFITEAVEERTEFLLAIPLLAGMVVDRGKYLSEGLSRLPKDVLTDEFADILGTTRGMPLSDASIQEPQ